MQEQTKNKMQLIIEAQQAKAQLINATPAPKPETRKEEAPQQYDNLADISAAAKSGRVIDLLNLSNLVNNKKPEAVKTPELSKVTIDDILKPKSNFCTPAPCTLPTQQEATPTEAPKQSKYQIIDYSEKAIALTGETKLIKDKLKAMGGKFNPRLSCGPGWIFSKKKLEELKEILKAHV